jgi:hypothetical protein
VAKDDKNIAQAFDWIKGGISIIHIGQLSASVTQTRPAMV